MKNQDNTGDSEQQGKLKIAQGRGNKADSGEKEDKKEYERFRQTFNKLSLWVSISC
jgi:hypothetical protein